MTTPTGTRDTIRASSIAESARPAGIGGPAAPAATGYDPRALAVAQAVYAAVRPAAIFLFGSRARGDYRPDSDIDLMLIAATGPRNRTMEEAAQAVARHCAERLYGRWVDVDVIQHTAERFHDERLSINRLAARVAEDGITVTGEGTGYGSLPYDDEKRREDVEDRLHDAAEHYATLELAIDAGRGDVIVGYNAPQTIEHSLKALTAALGGRYDTTHDLSKLIEGFKRTEREAGLDLGIKIPEHLVWLSEYAGGSKYDRKLQPIGDRPGLLEAVSRFQQTVAERLQGELPSP